MINKNLYLPNLKRLNILKSQISKSKQALRMSIYRNHSFEMISSILNYFLSESCINLEFVYSDYDDSLNFDFKEADIQVLWLDLGRYNTTNLVDFITERVNFLRAKTASPILVAYLGDMKLPIENMTTDCYGLNISELLNYLKDKLYDLEKEPYSGTRLSNEACIEIARELGLRYLPAILKTPLKAVVVDLDNTLYKGILGEDGIENLVPNLELQQFLKKLKDQGFFLCIASKNEEADVKKMFEERNDFILQWSDFTLAEINWSPKADNLIKIAKNLNIGLDSILFIDDNPAEIQNVEHIGVETILVDDDINYVLKYYPGLLKLKRSDEDRLRAADIQANLERAKLAQQMSPAQYFEKLGIKLLYSINYEKQIPRISELFGKTNQFILTYARFKESEVLSYMKDDAKCIITVHMSDNLSDSGIIAILAVHTDGKIMYLDELTVSCRALGRNLENIMLPYMFKIADKKLKTNGIINISYKEGPRNMPAMNWLSELVGTSLLKEGFVVYNIPEELNVSGLQIEVKECLKI